MAEPYLDYVEEDTGPQVFANMADRFVPGAGKLFGMAGWSPDEWFWNSLSGNENAYRTGSFMGRPRNMADVYHQQARDTWFKYSDASAQNYQKQALTGMYSYLEFNPDTSKQRAQNALDNIYSPAGLTSSLMMMSHGVAQADENFTQALLGSNMYAPSASTAKLGDFNQRQRTNFKQAEQYYKQFQDDYFQNVAGYGGLNMGEATNVMSEMTRRGQLGQQDFRPERAQQTNQKVKEMSRAVGSMQELFGGSIPEVFDKLDAVFGGTAGAMSGSQLQQRVLRLKQTSLVTGQSLQATAQMMMVGQAYAGQAGFDEGVGSAAAEQTAFGFGTNISDQGINMRRVNMERVRATTLRNNVAGATSRRAEYYAGAYQIWRRRQGQEGTPLEDTEANRNRFAGLVQEQGATDLQGLATAAGGTARDVQMMSLSDEARTSMMDDPNVARFGIRQTVEAEQRIMAANLAGVTRRFTDKKVAVEDFFRDGQLMGQKDVIKMLRDKGVSETDAASLVGGTFDSVSSGVFGLKNGAEFEARLAQYRGSEEIRQVVEARADFEQGMDEFRKPGGLIGLAEYFRKGGAEKQGKFGDLVNAAIGALNPEEYEKAVAGGMAKQGGIGGTFVQRFMKKMDKDANTSDRQRRQLLRIADNLGKIDQNERFQGKEGAGNIQKLGELIGRGEYDEKTVDELDYLLGSDMSRKQQDILTAAGTKSRFDMIGRGGAPETIDADEMRKRVKEAGAYAYMANAIEDAKTPEERASLLRRAVLTGARRKTGSTPDMYDGSDISKELSNLYKAKSMQDVYTGLDEIQAKYNLGDNEAFQTYREHVKANAQLLGLDRKPKNLQDERENILRESAVMAALEGSGIRSKGRKAIEDLLKTDKSMEDIYTGLDALQETIGSDVDFNAFKEKVKENASVLQVGPDSAAGVQEQLVTVLRDLVEALAKMKNDRGEP